MVSSDRRAQNVIIIQEIIKRFRRSLNDYGSVERLANSYNDSAKVFNFFYLTEKVPPDCDRMNRCNSSFDHWTIGKTL
jgi:hypothetical protein